MEIPAAERRDRASLTAHQSRRLLRLLRDIHGRNAFYTRKLDEAGIRLQALSFPDDLKKLPLTNKAEFVDDQDAHPPWGTALTEPLAHYSRCHQTSSTTGRPLRWLDTNESWQWVLECWKAVYRAAQVGLADRIFFPFSFGPFLGFWSAFEAGGQLGALCVSGGGISSEERLAVIDTVGPTVVCCTPTYALRLADVAAEQMGRRATLAGGSVRVLIVAGEPGGSIPATRKQIEASWGARVIDHHGLTEVGPISFECWESPGFLHLNECEYICEVLDNSGTPVADGTPGELVVTNLGRTASPVIRYRTGDIVVLRQEACRCGRTLARLEGGILARADDMVTIRGANVYPAAVEAVVRRFPEVIEYRATVSTDGTMRSLTLDIEFTPETRSTPAIVNQIAGQLHQAFGLTVPVRIADPGTLPRFELKAKRFVVEQPLESR